MPKYEVPLIEKNGVIKLKYEVERGEGVKVHIDIPRGVAVVSSDKEIKRLESKEDVKILKE